MCLFGHGEITVIGSSVPSIERYRRKFHHWLIAVHTCVVTGLIGKRSKGLRSVHE